MHSHHRYVHCFSEKQMFLLIYVYCLLLTNAASENQDPVTMVIHQQEQRRIWEPTVCILWSSACSVPSGQYEKNRIVDHILHPVEPPHEATGETIPTSEDCMIKIWCTWSEVVTPDKNNVLYLFALQACLEITMPLVFTYIINVNTGKTLSHFKTSSAVDFRMKPCYGAVIIDDLANASSPLSAWFSTNYSK